MHRLPKRANALAVDDTDAANACFQAELDIVRHQLADLRWPEGVEVKYAVDLEFDGVVFAHASSSFGSAGCFSMAAGSGSGSGAALSRASNFRAVTRRRLSTELIALL